MVLQPQLCRAKPCCVIVAADLLRKANSSSSLNRRLQRMVQQGTGEQILTYFHCLCTSSVYKSKSKISAECARCLKPCTNKSGRISVQSEKSFHQMTALSFLPHQMEAAGVWLTELRLPDLGSIQALPRVVTVPSRERT